MQDDLAVLVDRPGTLHRPSTTFPGDRVCEDCPTILSRYNPTRWCRVHEGPARRLHNIFGEFTPRVLRDIEVKCSERPRFRCDACELAWPILYQWITANQRFCAWCKPTHAHRTESLELAI